MMAVSVFISTIVTSLLFATTTSAIAIPAEQRALVDISQCKLAATTASLSAGHGYKGSCAPSTGTMKAFMFFVDFSDQPASNSGNDTPSALYSFFMPQVADWYRTASYGRLAMNVTTDTTRFYRMPATADSYGWTRGLTYEAHRKYTQDALDAYGKTIAKTDVLYIVPTRNARLISFSPTMVAPISTRAGVLVASGCVTVGYDAYSAWGYKVLNHETGHSMCLPDLYPVNGGATGQFVGGWDMMGLISGPSPDYFGWMKWIKGWLDDSQFNCLSGSGTTTHTLTPLEVTGGVKGVVVRQSATTAVVAEYRTAQGLNSATCAPGVLVYTVNTAVSSGQGPVRVLDARPSTSCSGDALNDATISINSTRSITVPGTSITFTITAQTTSSATIQVTV